MTRIAQPALVAAPIVPVLAHATGPTATDQSLANGVVIGVATLHRQ